MLRVLLLGRRLRTGTGDRVGALRNKLENKDIIDLHSTWSHVFYMRWKARIALLFPDL